MNKSIYLVITMVFFFGLGANWVIQKANSSHTIPEIKLVPNFSFINQDGNLFSKNNLLEKVTVLDFMFTSCAGPCPIMTNNMTQLYKSFDKIEEVQFLSITVDPETDDPKMLKTYASINGVNDERWQFLTSDIESIKNLKRDGFMLYADELPQGHAIKFVLIDQSGVIRKYYDGTEKTSMAVLKKDITQLIKEESH